MHSKSAGNAAVSLGLDFALPTDSVSGGRFGHREQHRNSSDGKAIKCSRPAFQIWEALYRRDMSDSVI